MKWKRLVPVRFHQVSQDLSFSALASLVAALLVFLVFNLVLAVVSVASHMSNAEVRSVYSQPWLWIGMYLVYTLAVCIFVRCTVFNSGYYLADLPWSNRVWPWLLTLLLGPIGWLTMSFSALGLFLFKPPLMPTTQQRRTAAQIRPADRITDRAKLKDYHSSPGVGKATYLTNRATAGTYWRNQRLRQVDGAIAEHTTEMKELSDRLKELRSMRGELQNERMRIIEMLSESNDVDDPQVIGEEFDRIMHLPGIIAVQVVDDRVRFIIRGSVKYQGATYDLGDWYVQLGADTVKLSAVALRDPVFATWGNGYPAYRYSDMSFCFGPRRDEINNHLAKGQFLEAMALTVECITTVNDDHLSDLPQAFPTIEPVPDQPVEDDKIDNQKEAV